MMTLKFIFTIAILLLCGLACFSDVDVDDEQTCSHYAQNFSVLLGNTVACFAAHSQPFSLCERCRGKYQEANTFFTGIQSGSMKDSDNRSCDNLVYGDRIQTLERLHINLQNIWTDSKCDNCFDETNHTRTFFVMHKRLYDCYMKYTDMPMLSAKSGYEALFSTHVKSYHFNNSACIDCLSTYSKLNDYFDRIQKHICMDVTDAMNHTRFEWSNLFLCHPQFIHAMDIVVPFIVGLVIVTAFYVLARVRNNTVHVRILKQKRMKLVTADSDDYSHASQ